MKVTNTHIYFYGNCIYSNWYLCEFTDPTTQIRFSNTEQAFMWYKANFFADVETRDKIASEPDPRKAKELGRTVKNYNNSMWEFVRFGYMSYANWLKFTQNPLLKETLLQTDEKVLVEASPVDCIWGVGLDSRDPKILDETNWRGQNLLGKCLMAVRANLANESKTHQDQTQVPRE